MTLIESSTSLLEKYANLHTSMEEARTETATCRSELQVCQGQIQDLLEQRQQMQEATQQACQEQEMLQQELDQQSRALESLQHDQDHVLQRRYHHAQQVQSMIQRRHETSRNDYEQSLQSFQMACQQFLQGKIQQQPTSPAAAAPVPSSSTRTIHDKALPSSSNAVSQQDPSHHDKENHSNNHDDRTLHETSPHPSPNTNLMKIDWKGLFAPILSTTNQQTLHDVLQEIVSDSEKQKTIDASDQESPSLTMNVDQPLTDEPETVRTTVIVADDPKTTSKPEGESKDSVVVPDGQQDTNNKQVLSTSSLSSSSSSFLFSQCLQVMDKLQLLKTQRADEAQAKLVALQAQYHQALQDHDHVHKDHAQWLAKITRQRSQKEQLQRQLERLQQDVQRLHQQMDQVHSQTLELQQERQESQTGSNKRPKTRPSSHNHHDQEISQSHAAVKVRNPYLQSTKTRKPKPSRHESNKSNLMTTQDAEKENDYPTSHSHHRPSVNESTSSSVHQRQANHSSFRRAMISPLAETSIHPRLTSATTTTTTTTRAGMPTNGFHEERVRESSTTAIRHHHRIGRVRGARDFGVSLSLESTSAMLSHDASVDNTEDHHVNDSKACLISAHHMDDMFPAQQNPTTTSSSNRMTPLVESTTRNTGTNAGKEPAVVSVAKKGRDCSTTTRLLHRRLLDDDHDFSSHHDEDDGDDSCLSEEVGECDHDDDHDNDDPVFHFVFRKE